MSKNKDFIIKDDVLIKYIGSSNFVIVPNNVKIIAENAFCDCDFIDKIEFPKSIIQIKEHAFTNCKSLKCISLYGKNLDFPLFPFENCPSIEKIIIEVDTFFDFKLFSKLPENLILHIFSNGIFQTSCFNSVFNPHS